MNTASKKDLSMTLRNAIASLGLLALMTAGAIAQPKLEKVPPVATSPASGKEMFDAYCAVCHGPNGQGDGPAAKALNKAPANLTQLAAKNGNRFPDAVVSRYIAGEETVAAHETRDMPMWGRVFHSMESNASIDQLRIRNLTDYVKSLQTN
jgi:mono/diheme cytochrome c family protein